MSNIGKPYAPPGSVANSTSSGLGVLSKRNLNAHTKPPPRPIGATHRGNLVVLGNKPGGSKGGMKALGVAAAPTPLNTPSLKRENNGKDLNAVLVPVGSGVWGSKNTEDKQGGEDDSSSQQQQQPTNETAEVEATVVVSKPAPWSTKSVETPAAASVPKEDPYKERKSSRLRSWVDEESDDDSPEDEEDPHEDEVDQSNKLRLNEPNEYGGRQDIRMQGGGQDFRRGPTGPFHDDDRFGGPRGDFRRFDDRGAPPPPRYRDDYRDPRDNYREHYRGDYRGDFRGDYRDRDGGPGGYRNDGPGGYRRGGGGFDEEPNWDRRKVEHAPQQLRGPGPAVPGGGTDAAQAIELARIEREQLEYRKKMEKEGIYRGNERDLYRDPDGPSPGRRDRLRSDSGDRWDRGDRYSYDEMDDRRHPMSVTGIVSRTRIDDGKGPIEGIAETDLSRNMDGRDSKKLLFDPKTGKMTAPVEKHVSSTDKHARSKPSSVDATKDPKSEKEKVTSSPSEHAGNWNRASQQPTVLSRPKPDKEAEKEKREKIEAETTALKAARTEERKKRGPRTKGVLYTYNNLSNELEQVLSDSEKAAREVSLRQKRGDKRMNAGRGSNESSAFLGSSPSPSPSSSSSSSSSYPVVAMPSISKSTVNLAPPDVPAWLTPQNTLSTIGVVPKADTNNGHNRYENNNGFIQDMSFMGVDLQGQQLQQEYDLRMRDTEGDFEITNVAEEFLSMNHMNNSSKRVFNTFIPGVGLSADVPPYEPSLPGQYTMNGAFDNGSGGDYTSNSFHIDDQYHNDNEISHYSDNVNLSDSSPSGPQHGVVDKKGSNSNNTKKTVSSARPPKRSPKEASRGPSAKVRGPPVAVPSPSLPTSAVAEANAGAVDVVEVSNEHIPGSKTGRTKNSKSKFSKSSKSPASADVENDGSDQPQGMDGGGGSFDNDSSKPDKKANKKNPSPRVRPTRPMMAPPPLV